jgi:hypothetical protein
MEEGKNKQAIIGGCVLLAFVIALIKIMFGFNALINIFAAILISLFAGLLIALIYFSFKLFERFVIGNSFVYKFITKNKESVEYSDNSRVNFLFYAINGIILLINLVSFKFDSYLMFISKVFIQYIFTFISYRLYYNKFFMILNWILYITLYYFEDFNIFIICAQAIVALILLLDAKIIKKDT